MSFYQESAGRIISQDWGALTDMGAEWFRAVAADLSSLRDAVRLATNMNVSLSHEQMRPPSAPYNSGVTQLSEEIAACLGGEQALTTRAPVTIDVLQPSLGSPYSVTEPALRINSRSNDPNATPRAIDTVGLIYENGVRLAGAQPLMATFWLGAAASVPAGWAVCDGAANSVANGGSGLNLVGSFIKCAATTAAAQTAASATGSGTASISAHTKAQVVATIADHSTHTHTTPALSHAAGSTPLTHSAHSAHAGTGSNLTHNATVPEHSHSTSFATLSTYQNGGATTAAYDVTTPTGNTALTITVSEHTPAAIAAVIANHDAHSDHTGTQVAAALADHSSGTTGSGGPTTHSASAGADLSHTDTGHTHTAGSPAHWEIIIIEKLDV